MRRQRFPFEKERPTYVGPPIPRLPYSEDLREGDLALQNKMADNILRLIFSKDHLSSARGVPEVTSNISISKESMAAFEEAAFNNETLKSNYSGQQKNLENFLKRRSGKEIMEQLRERYLCVPIDEAELRKIIINKFESRKRIKKDLHTQTEFTCDTVAVMIYNGICYIAANYKNREREQFVYGLQATHIELIQAVLAENNHAFYKTFGISKVLMITPVWDIGLSQAENNAKNAEPHAEMQCVAGLLKGNDAKNIQEMYEKNGLNKKIILGVSKSCCKKCRKKLKKCSISIPSRYGEHEIYLLTKLPNKENLKNKYKRTYIFIKKDSESLKLYYVNQNGELNPLTVQEEEFNQILFPGEINTSKSISKSNPALTKELWNIIEKNPGHIQLRKSNDEPKNWQDPSEIKVKFTNILVTGRRNSFEMFPEPKYKLYLVSTFNREECEEIQGDAVILTNKNTAYFVSNSIIMMLDDKPIVVNNINGQNIGLRPDGCKPQQYLASQENISKIVKECLSKRIQKLSGMSEIGSTNNSSTLTLNAST